MHEMTLLKDVVQKIMQVAEINEAVAVTEVRLQLGALAHISADHLREHFEHAVAGSLIEGASLIIEEQTDPEHPEAQEIVLRDVQVAVAS